MKRLMLFLLFLCSLLLFGGFLHDWQFRFLNLHQFPHQRVCGFNTFVLRHATSLSAIKPTGCHQKFVGLFFVVPQGPNLLCSQVFNDHIHPFFLNQFRSRSKLAKSIASGPGEFRLVAKPLLQNAGILESVWVVFQKSDFLIQASIKASIAIRPAAPCKQGRTLPRRQAIQQPLVFTKSFPNTILNPLPVEQWRQKADRLAQLPDIFHSQSEFPEWIAGMLIRGRAVSDPIGLIGPDSEIDRRFDFPEEVVQRFDFGQPRTESAKPSQRQTVLFNADLRQVIAAFGYWAIKPLSYTLNPLQRFWQVPACFIVDKFVRKVRLATNLHDRCRQRILSTDKHNVPHGLFDSHKPAVVDSAQLTVGDSLANNGLKQDFEPASVSTFPIIEPPCLFFRVPISVNWRNVRPGAFDGSLQQAPEVFHAVRVNLTHNPFFPVIDGRVDEIAVEAGVRRCGVGEHFRSAFYVSHDIALKRLRLSVSDNECANLATAFNDSLNSSFTDCSAPLDLLFSDVLVHVLRFSADERLICLNGAVQFLKRACFHRFANPMQHEPCRLLCNSQCPCKFVAADPVLCVRNQPDGDELFIQSERRIFKNRVYFHGKLLSTIFALPLSTARDPPAVLGTALRADRFAVRPLHVSHFGFTNVKV